MAGPVSPASSSPPGISTTAQATPKVNANPPAALAPASASASDSAG
jgi:hypothetical protein